MRFPVAAATAVLTIAMAPAAHAQASAVSPLYRVVAPGQKVKLWSGAAIDPDCRSLGRLIINLVVPPRGGEVGISYGPDFSTFAPANPRSACNRRRLPSTRLFYRANSDFTGTDSFVVEDVAPDGTAQRGRFVVTVR